MGATNQVLNVLRTAGFRLTLTPIGGLHVAPRDALTDDHRAVIRAERDALVLALRIEGSAANDPAAASPLNAPTTGPAEAPADPNAWPELAQAYHAHHFTCPSCKVAGRGAEYGLRCGAGAALWWAYQGAVWYAEHNYERRC